MLNHYSGGQRTKPAPFGHCAECSKPLTNTGGYQYPRYRCIARDCGNSVFKPVNPQATTWTALGFI